VNSVYVRLNKPVTSSTMCLSSACDDADGKTWCQSAHHGACSVLPHGGEDEHKMYLSYLDVSHELTPHTNLPLLKRCTPLCVLPYLTVAFGLSSTAQNVACGYSIP